MTYLQDRTPFLVRKPNQFDLSDHQPVLISPQARKLMPTIIRLAELVAVANPDKQYRLPINSQEELEVQIRAFEYLVNERHFPLFGYEDDEFMEEEINQWEEGWIDQTFHPLLDSIPVRPMGFADHDVDPSDYGDLVGLLYWLSTVNRESTPAPVLGTFWCLSEHRLCRPTEKKFRSEAVATILDGMDLQAPLAYLPGLISTVIKQTGTFFLDACPLCGNFLGPEFYWTAENFIWFRDDWQVAKPIHEGNQELIKWSHKSPSRLAEISQILRKAAEIHQFYKDDQPAWC